MCFHQLAVLAYPALALSVYLQSRALPARRRVANVVWFSLSALVLIVAAYALAFYHATAEFSVARLLRWTLSYSPDADTHFGFWSNLGYSLRGQVRLFFGGRLNLLHGLMKPGIVLLIALLVIAVLLLIVRLLWRLPALKIALKSRVRLEPQQKIVLWLALVWLATYLVFLFFWLPQNTFYRLFYLPAVVLLLGVALSTLSRSGPHRSFRNGAFRNLDRPGKLSLSDLSLFARRKTPSACLRLGNESRVAARHVHFLRPAKFRRCLGSLLQPGNALGALK